MSILTVWLYLAPANAVILPDGFTVKIGTTGTELLWTPSAPDQQVRMGSSRPEFRIGGNATGEVFGYPREVDGKLILILSNEQRELLATSGQDLEIWTSGRRGAPGALFAAQNVSSVAAAAATPTNLTLTTPTVDVNPAARGKSTTVLPISYSLPGLQLTSPDFPVKLEVVGEVIHPEKLTMTSKHPLVLFLHGRHSTCYKGGPDGLDSGDWPCPTGYMPIPSHQGYRYVADILASQGYVVVSISANGINGQDYAANDAGTAARSVLIRHHLALWAKWHTTGGDPWSGNRFLGKLDMNNVVLVGHSRGGEGVNRAAIDASPTDPFKIVGLVSYGPTAFGRQVTPDIHSVTILPTCDGDVRDLQGQVYVDGSRDIAYSEALRSAVIALGCNHNYFNTEWTPKLSQAPAEDDWFLNDDPVCGSDRESIRLTPQEQQVVGATYTAALVRMAVKQDAEMLQLLDGSFVRPKATGRADVAINAVGGSANRLLYRPEDDGAPTVSNGMIGGECRGIKPYFSDEVGCGSGDYLVSPHWLSVFSLPDFPAPMAMELSWTNKQGAYARFNITTGKNDLSSLDWVDVRVANDPNNDDGALLELVVVDKDGRWATVLTTPTSIEGWPGQNFYYELDRVHARTLRGNLTSVIGDVDLTSIEAILLVARSNSGRVWVLDIAASQAKIKQPVVLDLPVISVEALTVPEGNGPKTVAVKVTADKPLKSPGIIWMSKSSGDSFPINLAAGSNTQVAQVPYSIIGDKIYSSAPFQQFLTVGAVKGVITGNYIGGITILEDDPAPTLSVKKSTVTAKEGKSLIWELRLSAPTTGISFTFVVVPPSGGKELASNDVPTSWLLSSIGTPPTMPTPLSSLYIVVDVTFAYGVTKANLMIPVASDGIAEDEESIFLQGYGLKDELVTLTGKVPKHRKLLR